MSGFSIYSQQSPQARGYQPIAKPPSPPLNPQLIQKFSRVSQLVAPQDLFKQTVAPPPKLPAQPISLFPPAAPKPQQPKPQPKPAPAAVKPVEPVNAIEGTVRGVAKGTGYYPHHSKMEGGYKDMLGKPLHTLQDFLDGKSDYVSIALDKNMYDHYIKAMRRKYYRTGQSKYRKYVNMKPQVKYGDTFRIPELEKKYGRKIIFKAVDTGGAFTNKGFSRVDICTRNKHHSHDKTVNGKLTLMQVTA